MSIQKKSLISTLHAAKKANVAKADVAAEKRGEKQVSAYKVGMFKGVAGGNVVSTKKTSTRLLKTIF